MLLWSVGAYPREEDDLSLWIPSSSLFLRGDVQMLSDRKQIEAEAVRVFK